MENRPSPTSCQPLSTFAAKSRCESTEKPAGSFEPGFVGGGGAGAATAETLTTAVTLLSPGAEKLKVRFPADPVIERLVKVATPLLFVVAVSVPPSVPPPAVMAAVTTTPRCETEFPEASRNRTAGCCARAEPLVELDDGVVLNASCVAAPAVTVTVDDVADAMDAALNTSVRAPAVPVMERFEKFATPAASVVADV